MAASIIIEALTAEAFADFGDVIEAHEGDGFGINQGYTWRHHKLATVKTDQPKDDAIISIFSSKSRPAPIAITMMERHPLGSQAFIPMKETTFLAFVAPEGDKPDLNKVEAFIIPKGVGVNYNAGIWHFPLIATEDMNFLVVDRKGEGDNLVFYDLNKENITLEFQV